MRDVHEHGGGAVHRRAFSTLGCPGAGVDEVVDLAGRCTGVELRCAPGQLAAPDMPDADADALAARLAGAGLATVCLASYVRLTGAGPETSTGADLGRHLRLAARLGAPYLRVFGGTGSADRAVRVLAAAAPLAEELGVDVVLETHDAFPTGRQVAAVLAAVGSPAVGAVWDALHPWRAGESPGRTAAELGPWLRYVQVKDVAAPDDPRPVLCGHGVLPLADVVAQLRGLAHRGWISLEWERAWFPDAAPLDRALAAFHEVLDHV